MNIILVFLLIEGTLFLPLGIKGLIRWLKNGNSSSRLWPYAGTPEYLMEEFSSSIGKHYRLTHVPSGMVVSGTDKRLMRDSLDRRLRDLRSSRLDSEATGAVSSDPA